MLRAGVNGPGAPARRSTAPSWRTASSSSAKPSPRTPWSPSGCASRPAPPTTRPTRPGPPI
jgi:hypothetical protein